MKSSFCIDLQRFMLIPTKFPLIRHDLLALLMIFVISFLIHIGINKTSSLNWSIRFVISDIPFYLLPKSTKI